jgi:hypothetical protein
MGIVSRVSGRIGRRLPLLVCVVARLSSYLLVRRPDVPARPYHSALSRACSPTSESGMPKHRRPGNGVPRLSERARTTSEQTVGK